MKSVKLSQAQRNYVMQIYRPYLSDADLGKPFGLSRTRVHQILGGKSTEIASKREEIIKVIIRNARSGEATDTQLQACVKSALGKTYTIGYLRSLRQEAGVPSPHKRTADDRRAEIRKELKRFVKSGRKFNTGQLRLFNNNLFAAMTRTPPTDEPEAAGVSRYQAWAEDIGAVWEGRLK